MNYSGLRITHTLGTVRTFWARHRRAIGCILVGLGAASLAVPSVTNISGLHVAAPNTYIDSSSITLEGVK